MTTPRAGLVSTIITVHNRPLLVREAIESVLAQTYRPIEIIVVDDGSTDETASVCESLAAANPDAMTYVRRNQGGPAAASNTGLEFVTGEFVQFLDSDDLLAPEKFARQVAGLRADARAGISYCQTREYALGDAPSSVPSRRTGQRFERLFPDLLSGRIWPSMSPLYRRSVIDEAGVFLDSPVYQDWEYECRVAARGVDLHYCPEILADVRHTHQAEGRIKGQVSADRLSNYARVLEHIAAHADHGGVDAEGRRRFSGRACKVALRCAAAGLNAEADRLLRLARTFSDSRRLRLLSILVQICGWRRAEQITAWYDASLLRAAARAIARRRRAFTALWSYRASEAARTITGQPIGKWPLLLHERWAHRRSRARV